MINYIKFNKGKHKVIFLMNKNIKNGKRMFNECTKIEEIKFINFKTENFNNMSGMFDECSNLINLDINNFKTNKVKDMNLIFNKCLKLKSSLLFCSI